MEMSGRLNGAPLSVFVVVEWAENFTLAIRIGDSDPIQTR